MLITATLRTAAAADQPDLEGYRVGTLADPAISESSGLVCPGGSIDSFWTHNDADNEPLLFQLRPSGEVVARISMDQVGNRDWEDISVLHSGSNSQLVLADIGDNNALRSHVRLHVLNVMNDSDSTAIEVASSYRIRYPDGPRDSESVAVDSQTRSAWILSKRTIPAELYTVSLEPSDDEIVTATYVGDLSSLPQPTAEDIALAPEREDWFWQPTAMDFSTDGRRAAVLTYEGIYLYDRRPEDSWADAFARSPQRFGLGKGWEAEALCLTDEAVYWTTEGRESGLYRIPLIDPRWAAL